jgi:hypothetical protein
VLTTQPPGVCVVCAGAGVTLYTWRVPTCPMGGTALPALLLQQWDVLPCAVPSVIAASSGGSWSW